MKRLTTTVILTAAMVTLTSCERPRPESTDIGWRGLSMLEIENPRTRAADSTQLVEAFPAELPPTANAAPAPAGTWENVQVLGHLSVDEFNRTMSAITFWVAPTEGCIYCHQSGENDVDFASDNNYRKTVARQMLRMVSDINQNYEAHVGEAGGVNCYTCHAGNPIPENVWFFTDENQSLRHFLDRDDIRIQSTEALASNANNRSSIKQTENTYHLMMRMSNALGVGCTFCHQSSRFALWEESPPTRVKALRGIDMVRHINNDYLADLQGLWPAEQLGPMGDGPKVECATCHQGRNLPLYGTMNDRNYPAFHLPPAQMLRDTVQASGSSAAGGGGGD